MSIFNIISLLGGLAFFLYGMRVMGNGLKSNSSDSFRNLMSRATDSLPKSFAVGLIFAALIQSSKATIVLASGLVGAEIITFHQSLGIVLGANVGTTITGQIIRLLDLNADSGSLLNFLKPSTLAPLAAVVGIVFIMFVKGKRSETISTIAMGFAILFTGLLNMTSSVSELSQDEGFQSIFGYLSGNPILGFAVGFVVCAALQSQSATVGILQALSLTGTLEFKAVYSVLLGIYVGDSVTTALVCSIGAKSDPKRVGVFHIIFNIVQVLGIFVVVLAAHYFGLVDGMWDRAMNSGAIANVNTGFKLVGALALMPAAGKLEKLVRRIVPDDETEKDEHAEDFARLNENLYKTPGIALGSTFNALCSMSREAVESVGIAMDMIEDFSEDKVSKVSKSEDFVDRMADQATNYLAKLSPMVTLSRRSELLNYYLKCIDEFERISDHALNISENLQQLRSKGAEFSESALKEMRLLRKALDSIVLYSEKAFADCSYEAARHIEPMEQVVDSLVEHLREYHLLRLKNGQCNVYSGFYFLDILVNVERIADQCSNIGVHTVSLFDKNVGDMQHEYARRLERGEDPDYTREVEELTALYMGELNALEKGA